MIINDEKHIDARLGKPYIKAVILSDDTIIQNMQCSLKAKLDLKELERIDKENNNSNYFKDIKTDVEPISTFKEREIYKNAFYSLERKRGTIRTIPTTIMVFTRRLLHRKTRYIHKSK